MRSYQSIQQHLENKGVESVQVEQISMDLSPLFIAGAAESFSAAQITFDRFHVIKLLNEENLQIKKLIIHLLSKFSHMILED